MAAPVRVVDTSAWIEWLTGSAVGRKLGKRFPDKTQCTVPTFVQLELSKWLVRELGEEQADKVIAYTQKCVVVPLDTAIALLAEDLHREHKLATADAIVYATARPLRWRTADLRRTLQGPEGRSLVCQGSGVTVSSGSGLPHRGETRSATPNPAPAPLNTAPGSGSCPESWSASPAPRRPIRRRRRSRRSPPTHWSAGIAPRCWHRGVRRRR